MRSDSKTIRIGEMSWNERELAQIIRRKMITQERRNKKKYRRKEKHKGARESSFYFCQRVDKNTFIIYINQNPGSND